MKYFCKLLIILLIIISVRKFVSGGNDKNAGADDEIYLEPNDEGDRDEYDYDEIEYYDGTIESRMELPEDCISLKFLKLKRICDIVYPKVLAENYRDIIADVNEPYVVFQFPYEDTNRYFLSFHHSDIFYCKYLQVIDVLNYKCFNESDVAEDIVMNGGIIRCMNHPSPAIDLLLGICSRQLNESSVFTAMHYVNLLTLERSAGDKMNLRIEWFLHLGFMALWYILLSTKIQ